MLNVTFGVYRNCIISLFLACAAWGQTPTIFIAGDSTAADGNPDAIGWGKPLPRYFDASRVRIANRARGGRSSRTFITEGLWTKLLEEVQPNDYVLIQFGHNDGGPIEEAPKRGSVPGLGEETQGDIHTYGWYMRKMIRETREKGATPILFSLTVRNIWKDGHVERGSGRYGEWTRELAKTEKVAFGDLTTLIANRYEQLGEPAVKALFPKDHTHANEAGADINASGIIALLKATHENALLHTLSPLGRAIEAAPYSTVALPHLTRKDNTRPTFLRWLNLPEPDDPALPTLFLIGDSTVRNGRGDGADGTGQWGWGEPLATYFDNTKMNLVNRAVGGTGVRSFMAQGYWDAVLGMIRPGDFVIMQFGHNDNGPNAPIKGIGTESELRDLPGGNWETVHAWGWYLRRYIEETRARGAMPIVCTLVPRKIWENGHIVRPANSHADWAKAIAAEERVPLLDLYDGIAKRYDALGQSAVELLFADEHTHTSRAGAELNTQVVMESLQALQVNPVAGYLRAKPATTW